MCDQNGCEFSRNIVELQEIIDTKKPTKHEYDLLEIYNPVFEDVVWASMKKHQHLWKEIYGMYKQSLIEILLKLL